MTQKPMAADNELLNDLLIAGLSSQLNTVVREHGGKAVLSETTDKRGGALKNDLRDAALRAREHLGLDVSHEDIGRLFQRMLSELQHHSCGSTLYRKVRIPVAYHYADGSCWRPDEHIGKDPDPEYVRIDYDHAFVPAIDIQFNRRRLDKTTRDQRAEDKPSWLA